MILGLIGAALLGIILLPLGALLAIAAWELADKVENTIIGWLT